MQISKYLLSSQEDDCVPWPGTYHSWSKKQNKTGFVGWGDNKMNFCLLDYTLSAYPFLAWADMLLKRDIRLKEKPVRTVFSLSWLFFWPKRNSRTSIGSTQTDVLFQIQLRGLEGTTSSSSVGTAFMALPTGWILSLIPNCFLTKQVEKSPSTCLKVTYITDGG